MFLPSSKLDNITGGEWIEIKDDTKDSVGVISGYYIKHSDSNLNTLILYSHGNGGNLTWYIPTLDLLKNFGDVLVYDYPGYGLSKGTCNEKDVLSSGLIAYDYAVSLGYKRILCYGFSMGGSVSVHIASQRKPHGLILQSTFACICDCLPSFVQFTIQEFFRSIDKVKDIDCPVVILHSTEDGVVPYNSSVRLYNSLTSRKKFIDIKGGHNSAKLNEEIFTKAFNFLNTLISTDTE
jgi:pimeloyl-ACP methyl ester carboxylesterase